MAGRRVELVWVGQCRKAISGFPVEVKRAVGFALHLAQIGEKHAQAKPLKGFGGAGMLEVVEDHGGSTYRAVYTVKFRDAVYVLDAFQKKSVKGAKTPRVDVDRIKARLKMAEERSTMSASTRAQKIVKAAKRRRAADYEVGSGNVFADLGLPNPELELVKANLARAILARIRSLGLTQTQAARRMGIDQPRVSKLKCGRLGEFSLDTLFDLAMRIGIDLHIGLTEEPEPMAAGRVNVRNELPAA
jgi:phage-related protein/predicted XRE-type DNA-binding protein